MCAFIRFIRKKSAKKFMNYFYQLLIVLAFMSIKICTFMLSTICAVQMCCLPACTQNICCVTSINFVLHIEWFIMDALHSFHCVKYVDQAWILLTSSCTRARGEKEKKSFKGWFDLHFSIDWPTTIFSSYSID